MFLWTRRGFLASGAVLPGLSASSSEADCDVLVAGGSFGGVAAALAAADSGRRVILTEETGWIGGQATTQGVPLDEHPWIEERGRTRAYAQFRAGVREYYRRNYQLIEAARQDPRFNPGAGWVSACCFEPRAGIAVLNEMLAPHLSTGRIRILPYHQPIAVGRSGDRCTSVTFQDVHGGGRRTILAKYILDATELGDLLPLAGIEFVTGAESQQQTGEPSAREGPPDPLRQQPFTHLIAVDYCPGEDHRIPRPASYEKWRAGFKSMVGIADAKGDEIQLRMRRLFAPDSPRYASCIWNFRRVLCASNFAGIPSDVTMIMNGNEYHGGPIVAVPEDRARARLLEARELTLSVLYFFQNEIEPGYQGKPGYPGIRPRGDVFGTEDGLAQYPYIRESRRIQAEFTVLEQHFRIEQNPNGPTLYKDSVGTGGYRIDIHERAPRGGSSQTIHLHGKHWTQQIPLGALIPKRVENVLPACKNLGVTHVTNGAFRLHPVEWNVGEAAGALAAFCLQRNLEPRQVRNNSRLLEDFQRLLTGRGVPLAWDKPEVAKSYNSHYAEVPGWYFGEARKKQA
jgi:hypothetical protein